MHLVVFTSAANAESRNIKIYFDLFLTTHRQAKSVAEEIVLSNTFMNAFVIAYQILKLYPARGTFNGEWREIM